jgi:glycosyltransferase involved in cell wall biosynthesis
VTRQKVLLVANDLVGTSMGGPGIRYWRFAEELCEHFDVTLSVPFKTDLQSDRFRVVVSNPWSSREMTPLARRFEAVVAQRLPVPTMLALAASPTRAIYDLYAPLPIENLAFDALEPGKPAKETYHRLNTLTQSIALQAGDAFICASETQRDLWLGALLMGGRIDHGAYARDRSLRGLIDVVPFGIDPELPRRGPGFRGVVPGIGERDEVVLWGGGIWNWFDPLTVIRAVDELRKRRTDLRLVFLGTTHPNSTVPAMRRMADAIALSNELGLIHRHVFFNNGWVPFAERGAHLLDADVGVSAHFDDLEARFAFRTRILDYFWAGLPVVATKGDALSDLVAARELGRTVAAEDVSGWVDALDDLLGDEAARADIATRLASVREEFAWPHVVEPLVRLLSEGAPARRRLGTILPLARYGALRATYATGSRGLRGTLKRLVDRRPPEPMPPVR